MLLWKLETIFHHGGTETTESLTQDPQLQASLARAAEMTRVPFISFEIIARNDSVRSVLPW